MSHQQENKTKRRLRCLDCWEEWFESHGSPKRCPECGAGGKRVEQLWPKPVNHFDIRRIKP